MIRVNKPAEAPEVLRTKGVLATAKLCDLYDAGTRTFTFRREIYAADEVKTALNRAQYKKCCFCERLVGKDGHVEHFRPKGGVCQDHDEPISETGYYWLAYEWSNLLLCCADCNVRHKANLFPLQRPEDRALYHKQDCSRELPLFIQPAEEDPELLIAWAEDIPKAAGGNARADTTLKALRLNANDRDGLMESRRSHFATVRHLLLARLALRAKATPEATSAATAIEAHIRFMAEPRSQFSAMVKALLHREGLVEFVP